MVDLENIISKIINKIEKVIQTDEFQNSLEEALLQKPLKAIECLEKLSNTQIKLEKIKKSNIKPESIEKNSTEAIPEKEKLALKEDFQEIKNIFNELIGEFGEDEVMSALDINSQNLSKEDKKLLKQGISFLQKPS